ncbi:anaerobic ribonucleoside-triphosphate reductase [Cetobacterium sp.]|uniref:anaerobic ribonucleoside-triphosphate reductase n=1 Tax=Cetobacterium sp. TaxID=2071632 RepID=UPI003F316793
MEKIYKRDGKLVGFDIEKIINAIMKAKKETKSLITGEEILHIAESISKVKEILTVEEIQDLVVKKLMATKHKDLALAYQDYRAVKNAKRKNGLLLMNEISTLLDKTSEKLSENANKDSKTISVQRDLLAGVSSKTYYLKNIVPKHIAKAHELGELHLHDLDYLVFPETNCELVHLERMLKGGCKIGNASMSEPNGIDVAVGHTIQIIASVSSNTYGGCTIPYIDRTLTPYVRKTFVKHYNNGIKYLESYSNLIKIEKEKYFLKDWKEIYKELEETFPKAYKYALDLTKESVNQAMQGMEYEINSLSTVNGQTPFTTLGFGTETTWEGRLIQEMILRNRMGGFGQNKLSTAIFPKLVYAVCEGHNFLPGDINRDITDIAFECMTKAIYPDLLFVTLEQIEKGTVVYPMGCRAYLSPWFDKDGNEVYAGRFNMGATTINLPRIAIKNQNDEAGFYKELDRVLEICRDNCLFRAKFLENVKSDVAPILWQSGALAELKPGETIKELVWGGYATISIGYIGLSEVSKLLYGKDFALDEEIHKKTYDILKYIKAKMDNWKKEDNLGYAFYSTPSESLCDRFARIDLKEFGNIEGVTDKGYYENSFHVASNIEIDPIEKMRIEAPAHSIATGGHISYVEAPDLKRNLKAVNSIVQAVKELGVHYFGINSPVDNCFICGYNGEFLATEDGFTCPVCGNHDSSQMNVIRRVCGYLAQPDSRPFNEGKQKEVINRVKHMN